MSGKLPCLSHFNDQEKQLVKCLNSKFVEKRFCERYMCKKCYHQECSICQRSVCSQCRLEPNIRHDALQCCDKEHLSDIDSFYGGKEAKFICPNCRFRCRKCFGNFCNKVLCEVSRFDNDKTGTFWEKWCKDCVDVENSENLQRIKRFY